MDKNQQIQYNSAKKYLLALDTLPCNVEGSQLSWKEIIQNRKEAVNEYLTFLETGKTDHINPNIEPIKHEHFK